MKSTKKILVLASLAVFLAALPSIAQSGGKKIEVTLYGGFSLFSGTGTASDNPDDLYSGDWSPFFGGGYDYFSWLHDVETLDSVIGNSILERKSGPQFGLKLGFRITPSILVEGFFEYSLSKFQFTDAAWDQFGASTSGALAALEDTGRNPDDDDLSVREDGTAMNFGLNVNIDLAMGGKAVPYLSLGAFVSSLQGFPSIDYVLNQYFGSSSASYGIMVDYENVTAIGFGGGIGARINLSPDMGLKIEARGSFLPIKVDQRFEATFDRTGTGFFPFQEFDDIAAVEKINQLVITLNAGFFFRL